MARKSKKRKNNNSRLATLWRRAEKGWRFRDIERSWTHFVWSLTTTAQTMLLGIIAIVSAINHDATPTALLVAVFVLTVFEICIFYILAFWRRRIDSDRARHFEESVRASELGIPYDNNKADQAYDNEEYAYRKVSQAFEKIAAAALAGNIACLIWALYNMPRGGGGAP